MRIIIRDIWRKVTDVALASSTVKGTTSVNHYSSTQETIREFLAITTGRVVVGLPGLGSLTR